MSTILIDTDPEKEENLHTSVQDGRYDQIYPSNELCLARNLRISHPLDPDDDEAFRIGGYNFNSLHNRLFFESKEDRIKAASKEGRTEEELRCWRERGPNDTWVYLWSDGVKFEGEMDISTNSGNGKFTWPSNATYEGTFLNRCLHGEGAYTGSNGYVYEGNWIMNLRHGFGLQHYSNGDVYRGAWYRGKKEGLGTYTWANGNFYNGAWKGNVMSGRGKLTWNNGDSFNGDWAHGEEHGHGIYMWSSSATYIGTWSRGLKDGKGTFFPPGMEPWLVDYKETPFTASTTRSKHSSQRWHSAFGVRKFLPFAQERQKEVMIISQSSSRFLRKSSSLSKLLTRSLNVDDRTEKDGDNLFARSERKETLCIVDREYAQGVLINEVVKAGKSMQFNGLKRSGGKIIKGHTSYDLMRDLQLGIRYTVGKFRHIERDLDHDDFAKETQTWMKFPREGSKLTPSHQSVNFKWKDYCPSVFGMLREMFKIEEADYLISICGNDGLRELSSPGKSGSVFYLSHDERFLIKTLRKQEMKVLLKMLPKYHNHVCKYENTLITKFFGLHCIKLDGGHKVRFVVMGNVFCSQLRIHRRYDLKGSSLGRSANKLEIDETTILKDLDLDFTFHMEPSWRRCLLKQIEEDCKFLESEQIMDYSLLLGIHFRAPPQQHRNRNISNAGNECILKEMNDRDETYREGLMLVARERCTIGRGIGGEGSHSLHSRGSGLSMRRSYNSSTAGDEDEDEEEEEEEEDVVDLIAGSERVQIQLGVNMPARAYRQTREHETATEADQCIGEVYDVALCLGIIDILQEYNASKRLEHAYKSIKFDSISISVVEPHFYSKRFQEFIRKAFPDDEQTH